MELSPSKSVLFIKSDKREVFEIAGDAGAGKSTIVKLLSKNDQVSVCFPPFKVDIFLVALIKAVVVTLFFAKPRFWLYITRKSIKKIYLYEYVNRQALGIWILEEGPWHFIYGHLASRRYGGKIADTLFKVLVARIFSLEIKALLYLNYSPDVLYLRRRGRGKPREDEVDINEIRGDKMAVKKNIDYISEYIFREVKIVEVTKKTPVECVEFILFLILRGKLSSCD